MDGGFGIPALSDEPQDGSTVVSINGDTGDVKITTPYINREKNNDVDFNENLASKFEDSIDLTAIAQEVSDGVEHDDDGRKSFIDTWKKNQELLGLKNESQAGDETSKVGHPLLLEAIISAQASAGGELMPAEGPAKVVIDGLENSDLDDLAKNFEDDINTYLTSLAPEYYPDLDRGLFGFFFGGNLFRKIGNHRLRRRPVAESVGIEDLIVPQSATDLETALRITHKSMLDPVTIKRMMKLADWRDVILGDAAPRLDGDLLGGSEQNARPQDMSREMMETTVDLDLADYGYADPEAPDGLPVSYIVTWERESQEVLAIRRGWDQDSEEFLRKSRFIHYGMIPTFDFLCLGFSHILGNQVQVLRGVWRMLLTSGMYSNAPGGVKRKGLKVSTTDIRPGPGKWVDVDVGDAQDIRQAMMALPYKDVSPAFMEMAQMVEAGSARMAGAATTETGEGRTNAPVGTMMSLIEVQTRTMAAVHKRMHRAQAQELEAIRRCFLDDPDALTKLARSTGRDPDMLFQEFSNYRLRPASDPNVPSQVHRIQLAGLMVQIAAQNPDIYDRKSLHEKAWRSLNQDMSQLLHDPVPQPGAAGPAPPDPLIGQAKIMDAQARQAMAQAKMAEVQQAQVTDQRKAANEQLNAQLQQAKIQLDYQLAQQKLASGERQEENRRAVEATRLQIEQLMLQIELSKARDAHALATNQSVADTTLAVHQTALDHAAALHQTQENNRTKMDIAKMQSDTQKHIAKTRPKPSPAGRR